MRERRSPYRLVIPQAFRSNNRVIEVSLNIKAFHTEYRAILPYLALDANEKLPGARVYDRRICDIVLDSDQQNKYEKRF
uniref:Toxin CcdB n=1 Tax=Heterorhabditis bacteriophora TaxID=37862 RepID=A0A1I7WRB1_HETBA